MPRKKNLDNNHPEEEPAPSKSIDSAEWDAVSDFDRKVYKACMKIPRGKVTTYSHIAKAIGSPRACRAVGTALRKNPFALKVPCYRVVSSARTLGGFMGSTDPTGKPLQQKKKILEEEGVMFDEHSGKRLRVAESSVFTF